MERSQEYLSEQARKQKRKGRKIASPGSSVASQPGQRASIIPIFQPKTQPNDYKYKFNKPPTYTCRQQSQKANRLHLPQRRKQQPKKQQIQATRNPIIQAPVQRQLQEVTLKPTHTGNPHCHLYSHQQKQVPNVESPKQHLRMECLIRVILQALLQQQHQIAPHQILVQSSQLPQQQQSQSLLPPLKSQQGRTKYSTRGFSRSIEAAEREAVAYLFEQHKQLCHTAPIQATNANRIHGKKNKKYKTKPPVPIQDLVPLVFSTQRLIARFRVWGHHEEEPLCSYGDWQHVCRPRHDIHSPNWPHNFYAIVDNVVADPNHNNNNVTSSPLSSPPVTINKGFVRFLPSFLDPIELRELQAEIRSSVCFKQYKFMSRYNEPRLHALYTLDTTNNNKDTGYVYHSVHMKAEPLEHLPKTKLLALKMAKHWFGDHNNDKAEETCWNVGLDIIVYRNGNDWINWHADDTQGETRVVAVVVESTSPTRTVCIQPKQPPPLLQPGDTQVELFPEAGDAYEMNGITQEHYVHAILQTSSQSFVSPPASKDKKQKKSKKKVVTANNKNKVQEQEQQRRVVIIFRHGRARNVAKDQGSPVPDAYNSAPLSTEIKYKFGSMPNVLQEGHLYSRRELVDLGAHCADRKGVSGNRVQGCDAIIMTNCNPQLGELDDSENIQYHVPGHRQGLHALTTSHEKKKAIRVFRSSLGNSHLAPPRDEQTELQQSQSSGKSTGSKTKGCHKKSYKAAKYRYDGIYRVKKFVTAPAGGTLFYLERVDRPRRSQRLRSQDDQNNGLSNEEMKMQIWEPARRINSEIANCFNNCDSSGT